MLRADMYSALAEAVSEPPEWMVAPGREWPLFEIATRLAPDTRCLSALAKIRAEPLAGRRKRYAALFVGSGRPRFWLYESAFLTGRILGPATFAVEKLYRAAGLDTLGAELPDHASMELAFLAHLAESVETTGPVVSTDMERRFIETHAGRWLPQLGKALAHSGDEVYAPIGQLLADWLREVGRKQKAVSTRSEQPAARRLPPAFCLPLIPQPDSCTLCGFCVQVCPTRALTVCETSAETKLVLSVGACNGCGKCERICQSCALHMEQDPGRLGHSEVLTVLRESPRARCSACGAPTVSRAELEFVAAQIGHPAWLDYCGDCRPHYLEIPR